MQRTGKEPDAMSSAPQISMLAVAATLAVAAFGPGTPAAEAAGPVTAPNPKFSYAATVLAPTTARSAPRFSGKRVMTLQPVAPLGGGAQTLLVRRTYRDSSGKLWVSLQLPIRPNWKQGWVPADTLRFRKNPLRVAINQKTRKLTVFKNNKRLYRMSVAVGENITPTPAGKFAVAEYIHTNTPGSFIGPVVFPLTGYSNVLNEYAGGNGRFAIHGTALPELIGTRASHGCIRLKNRDVVKLSRLLRPGTPVAINSP